MAKENKKDESGSQKSRHRLLIGSKKALAGGVLAGSISFGGQWLVGQVYSVWEARQLLESVAGSALYLGGAIVTSSATIIALMLTIIGLTRSAEKDFDPVFFKRIQRIGLLSSISMISGILLLLFLSIPLQESDQVPPSYFKTIYYFLIVFVALLSGLLVSIVLMLLNAINGLIEVVSPDVDEEVEKAKERDKKS